MNDVLLFVRLLPETEGPTYDTDWLKSLLAELWCEEFRDALPRPAFGNTSSDVLLRLLRTACARDPRIRKESADLERTFTIQCTQSVASSLAEALTTSRRMEYVEVGTTVGASLSVEYQLTREPVDQAYLDDAPLGVAARYAWGYKGGKGSGVRFIDIENDWNLEHEDLFDAGITLIAGERTGNNGDQSHGVAVLGIVAAQDNGKEVLGIAHDLSSVQVVGLLYDQLSNLPRGIMNALLNLRFGDVLLLEVNTSLGKGLRPVEIQHSVHELIRLATALGVVVIEPSGNGACDLDAVTRLEEGRPIRFLNPFRDEFRDSGAIVVGGCRRGYGHPRQDNSNYGSRIDCCAWGESVTTLWNSDVYRLVIWGGGLLTLKLAHHLGIDCTQSNVCPPLDLIDRMYNAFSGTSSAAAIIAGVAICVQSLAQANLGFRFSPWQVRLILSDPANGTSTRSPESDRIGVMPDLRKIIDQVLRLSADGASLFEPLPPPVGQASREVRLVERSLRRTDQAPDYVLCEFQALCRHSRRRLRVEVLARLPREARVWLEMPNALSDLKGIWAQPRIGPANDGNFFMPVNPNGQTYFREAEFPHDSHWRLVVQLPQSQDQGKDRRQYEIAARLMEGWRELSRAIWTI